MSGAVVAADDPLVYVRRALDLLYDLRSHLADDVPGYLACRSAIDDLEDAEAALVVRRMLAR